MKKILFLFIVTTLALASCKSGGDEDIYQISDPAKRLEAAVGNEFKIVIESNPSTGYHWELVDELNKDIVQFVSREYRTVGDVIPGSGGVDVWTFKTVAAGETEIVLGYYPPSNDPTDPEQTVTFSLSVK